MKNNRIQLVIVLGLLLFIGFSFVSLASFHVSRKSLRSLISQNILPISSDMVYSEIIRDFQQTVYISSLMASDTFLRDWVLSGEKDSSQIERYLAQIQEKYGTFTSFLVSDKTDNYYYRDGVLKQVSPDEERDIWYYRVRDLDKDFEINVDPDFSNRDAMTIFVNYRVFDYDGNFIGAAGVGQKVSVVAKIFDRYRQKYHRMVMVVDSEGRILLHDSSIPAKDMLGEIEGLGELAGQILANPGKEYEYEFSGEHFYVNTRYMDEIDGILLIVGSDKEATRQIVRSLMVNMLLCIIITAIVLMLTNLTVSAYQKTLEKMAVTDKLSGLYNRQAFDVILTENVKEMLRKDEPFSVLMLDIDHFKQVNDNYGHLKGDHVIQHIAHLCRENLRESDVVCRWGGEEIIILMRECSLDDAYVQAEKIRSQIAENPVTHDGVEIPVTVSFGVAQYTGLEDEDCLLNRVDQALYMAKASGRNQSVKSEG